MPARPLDAATLPAFLGSLLLACTGAAARTSEVRFDGKRAWSHLEEVVAFGERPAGSASIERLRSYLIDQLTKLHLEPVREAFREETPIGPIDFCNVYVDIPGSDAGPTSSIIVFCTHYDTKRGLEGTFVGANDGGSGTAVLLELARCLAEREKRSAVTYRLLFLDGEEAVRPKWAGKDNCYGSRHHVAELERAGALERVKACVLLDMIGDRDLRLTHELYSDARLLRIVSEAAHSAGLEEHVGATPREIRDDHLSFQDAGVPSVDLIDFEYGPANEYWHSAADTLDKCSAQSLEAIGRILLACLPALDGLAAGG